MELEPFVRPRYFSGKVLTADDLQAEQDYHRRKHRLHNRALHGSGVAFGLDVAASNGAITVTSGLALDGYGREIVVPDEQTISIPGGAAQRLDLCLRYAEKPSDEVVPVPGGDPEPAAIVETFELALETDAGLDCVVLAVVKSGVQGNVVLDTSERTRVR